MCLRAWWRHIQYVQHNNGSKSRLTVTAVTVNILVKGALNIGATDSSRRSVFAESRNRRQLVARTNIKAITNFDQLHVSMYINTHIYICRHVSVCVRRSKTDKTSFY